MRQRVVYFVMIWVAVTSVSAQEAKKWTLDDCIDRQSRTISQSVVQYRTECDEPSVSGNQ